MDLIELFAELELSFLAYKSAKILQLVYQIVFVIFLLSDPEMDTVNFTVITCFIIAFILITYTLIDEYDEKLHSLDGYYKEYINLILMELLVFSTAITGYLFAIKAITKEYGDCKEELYYAHHNEDSLRVKMSELNNIPSNLGDKINEHIETVTNHVLDKVPGIPNIISFMHSNENFSVRINSPLNASMIQTSHHKPSQQVFDDFYFKYVTLQLIIPSVISIIIQLFPVVALGSIEKAKYEIRKVL